MLNKWLNSKTGSCMLKHSFLDFLISTIFWPKKQTMEAVAKYSYTASSPSELSFSANDTMKVRIYSFNFSKSESV